MPARTFSARTERRVRGQIQMRIDNPIRMARWNSQGATRGARYRREPACLRDTIPAQRGGSGGAPCRGAPVPQAIGLSSYPLFRWRQSSRSAVHDRHSRSGGMTQSAEPGPVQSRNACGRFSRAGGPPEIGSEPGAAHQSDQDGPTRLPLSTAEIADFPCGDSSSASGRISLGGV